MNKLWVYGCSFSEPFGIELGGPQFFDNGYRNITADYWGTHLADKLNRICVTRSISGVGWNKIVNTIDEDITTWTKEDIIIISPSFLDRATILEFHEPYINSNNVALFKDWQQLFEYNKQRWLNTIRNLQHIGYNVYTWIVNDIPEHNLPNKLITAPDNSINWKHWMDKHYEYWTSLPGVVYPAGDWHFNPQGHIAVADRMYEVICQQQ